MGGSRLLLTSIYGNAGICFGSCEHHVRERERERRLLAIAAPVKSLYFQYCPACTAAEGGTTFPVNIQAALKGCIRRVKVSEKLTGSVAQRKKARCKAEISSLLRFGLDEPREKLCTMKKARPISNQ